MSAPDRLVTIAQAAQLTGLTKRAIQGRIERGSLVAEKRGSRRYVRLVDLYEQGLIRLDPARTVEVMLDRIEELAQRVGELEAELGRREK